MGDVLKFPGPDERLRGALLEVRDGLERIGGELHLLAVVLATEGVWREWSDSLPEGTMFFFDRQMLRESGDEVVERLVELYEAAEELAGLVARRGRPEGGVGGPSDPAC